jgi:hypothetical protein
VEFCEKLREKSSILSGDGEDTKAPKILRGANNVPGNLALATVARFLPGPKKGPATFVDSLNNTRREGTCSHSVGDHGGKDRVYQKKATSNGERGPIQFAHMIRCLDIFMSRWLLHISFLFQNTMKKHVLHI